MSLHTGTSRWLTLLSLLSCENKKRHLIFSKRPQMKQVSQEAWFTLILCPVFRICSPFFREDVSPFFFFLPGCMVKELLELSWHENDLLLFLAQFFPPLPLLFLLFLLLFLFGHGWLHVFHLGHPVREDARRKLAQERVGGTGRGTPGAETLKKNKDFEFTLISLNKKNVFRQIRNQQEEKKRKNMYIPPAPQEIFLELSQTMIFE